MRLAEPFAGDVVAPTSPRSTCVAATASRERHRDLACDRRGAVRVQRLPAQELRLDAVHRSACVARRAEHVPLRPRRAAPLVGVPRRRRALGRSCLRSAALVRRRRRDLSRDGDADRGSDGARRRIRRALSRWRRQAGDWCGCAIAAQLRRRDLARSAAHGTGRLQRDDRGRRRRTARDRLASAWSSCPASARASKARLGTSCASRRRTTGACGPTTSCTASTARCSRT